MIFERDKRYKSPEDSAKEVAHLRMIELFFGEKFELLSLRARLLRSGYDLANSDDVYDYISSKIQRTVPVIDNIYKKRTLSEYKENSYRILYREAAKQKKGPLDTSSSQDLQHGDSNE